MLADAVAAEFYKFLRQKGGLFWGFCAVPLAVLLFNLGLDSWVASRSPLPVGLDLGNQVLRGVELGGNAIFQIFFIAGAVSLFAGEYRWETWRLLTPRNSRANLMLAKFTVYAVLAAFSLIALGLGGALHTLYAALLGAQMTLPGPAFPLLAAGILVTSWLELLVLGLVVALIAAASRAMIGPLIAAISFAFAQSMAMLILGPSEAPLRWFAAFPGMSAWYLRAWITGGEIAPGVFADPLRALPAPLFLLGWIGLLGAATLLRFQRQDLTRE